MPRLHLAVLTARIETLRLWKWIYQFKNSNFMPAMLSRLSNLHKLYIAWPWQHKNTFIHVFFVRHLVIKPACVKATLRTKRKCYAAFILGGFLRPGTKPDVCKNSFPSYETQISCLQYATSFLSSLRELDNKKVLFCKLFVRYLVVKPACVNAALD